MRTQVHSLAAWLALAALVAPDVARAEEAPPAAGEARALEPQGRAAGEVDDAGTPDLSQGLKIYGFMDFGYSKWLVDSGNSWRNVMPHHGAFSVGNVNMYLDGRIAARARSLLEARLTYLPNGVDGRVQPTSGGGLEYLVNGSTNAIDYTKANVGRASWGSVVLERAWVEWSFSDLLTIRAGQFLTPYGIWNVDHGSPAIVGVMRPYVINAQLIPERQVGLELYGSRWAGPWQLGYHATVSNGRMEGDPLEDRTAVAQYLDEDGRLSYGARIFAEREGLRVGSSAFVGRYTVAERGVDLVTGEPFDRIAVQYDEWAVGLDLRYSRGPLFVQGEALYQAFHYTPESLDVSGVDRRNSRDGSYLILGWRVRRFVMPFVTLQTYAQDRSLPRNRMYGVEGGVNVHLAPTLVFKASFTHYEVPRAKTGSIYADPLRVVATQLAWTY